MISFILQTQAAALRISGADANTYLQGQFTNDLAGEPALASYGLWLNQKGRVQADSTLLKLGPNEWLAHSRSIPGDSLMKRLNDYIIADEVAVEDVSALWQTLLLWGETDALLRAAEGANTPEPGKFHRIGGGLVFSSREPSPSAVCLVSPAGEIGAITEKLRLAGAQLATAEDFARERLRHRVPAVPQDLGPADFPQEGGLEGAAISFTKGCFLGQEVMARLENRGQVRRRLEVLRGEGTPPACGATLYQAGKKVGETRSAATDGGGFLCFAMITLAGCDLARAMSLAPDGPEGLRLARP